MVLIVPNTYLVSINAESGGQPVTNVIGVRGQFTGADAVTLAVRDAWTKTAGPISRMNQTYQMRDVKAMFLGQADGEVFTRQSTATGSISTSKSTNAACALVSYGGSSRARTNKGRMYFGPISEVDVNADGRTLATATVGAINSAFAQFRSDLSAAGLEWVVVSRKLQSATGVQSVNTQAVIATQRRRIR